MEWRGGCNGVVGGDGAIGSAGEEITMFDVVEIEPCDAGFVGAFDDFGVAEFQSR